MARAGAALWVEAACVAGVAVWVAVWTAACSPGSDPPRAAAPRADCSAAATSRSVLAEQGLLRPLRGAAGSPFPAAGEWRSIGDDARAVLPGVPSREIFHPDRIELPARAPVRWRVPIRAGALDGVARVLVAPRIGVPGAGLVRLDPVPARVHREGRHGYVEVDVDLSAVPAGRGPGTLVATLYAAPVGEHATLRVESDSFRLADGPAWLEFAIGLLEPRFDPEPVTFRVEACRGSSCRCLHQETLDAAHPGWQERALRIDPRDGPGDAGTQETRLRFVTRPAAHGDAGESLVLGAWTRPRLLVPSGDATPGRHDLILVSLDTLRADHLGAYGYARETSPFMSGELAARSTSFAQATSPATATGPSHMTLFTGLPPAVHGVTSNLATRSLPDHVATLAAVLRDRGYVTGAVDENGALSRRLGFGRGFDEHRQFFAGNIMKPTGFVAEVFDEGLAFLERHPGQRFFLFLHTYEVHSPYAPPARYRGLFREGDLPRHPDNQRVGPGLRHLYPVNYDREIRHVDTELERLVRALEAGGWLEDAILVVTSDHGEAFGEHGTTGHGSDVYQESVHVPLYFMGPGIAAGRRVEAPVGLIDWMPTALDLLGVPAPPGIVGRSFASLVRGETTAGDVLERVVVVESWSHRKSESGDGVASMRSHVAYRLGPHKLIRRVDAEGAVHEELYDLEADPGEERDLLADGAAPREPVAGVLRTLRTIADAHAAREAGLVDRLGEGAGGPGEALDPEKISPERLEALRILGYVE